MPQERQVQRQVKAFSGPLPSPEDFNGYEQVLPGSAQRILKLLEAQTAHRMDLEARVIENNIRLSGRGQIFAFVLALVTIAGGIACILLGRSAEGLASVITSLVALLLVFFAGRRKEDKERREKANAINAG